MCRSARLDERARLARRACLNIRPGRCHRLFLICTESGLSSNTSVIGCAGDLPPESTY